MLGFALVTGIYSYGILILGLTHYLSYFPVLYLTFLYFVVLFVLLLKSNLRGIQSRFIHIVTVSPFSFVLIILLSAVNLAGALSPETAFDALWYHLTIPKIFINEGRVFFIEGGLFYYSLLPKLTEMLNISSLMFGSELWAKLSQFIFGILTCFVTYRIGRVYVSRYWSILGVVIFYSNLVVSWLSTTAYSDLTRVFYESLAFLYFSLFLKKSSQKYLFLAGVLLGFAICAKIISVGSVLIFVLLLALQENKSIKTKVRESFLFSIVSLFIPAPWFVISFFHSANPFYPLFSGVSPQVISLHFLYPFEIVRNLVNTFLFSADPISPLYILVLPLAVVSMSVLVKNQKNLILFCVISLIFWYLATQSGIWHSTSMGGGSRFLSAHLPVYSIMVVVILSSLRNTPIRKATQLIIFGVTIISIAYRAAAEVKYIPYLLGRETKESFLMNNLNFSFGDFYDEEGQIKAIVGQERVLIAGAHNLFYADFNFTANPQDKDYEYVVVQGENTSLIYRGKFPIYVNKKTHVKLYRL